MKFGIFFLLHSPTAQPSAAVYARALEEMAYADELGFDSVWLAEHHFSNYGYCSNPLMLAVRVAQATRRVRIGTAVLVLPFWQPLRLAEDIATADVLTEGRIEIGVARGYQPYEFERFGLNIEESRARSEETLEVTLKALTTPGFSHEGTYYQITETATYPRPLQKPHPPFWLGATTEESYRTAVRYGFGPFSAASARPISTSRQAWKYFSDARRELGATGPYEFGLQQHVIVAPTDAEARARLVNSRWHFRQQALLRANRARVTHGVALDDPVPGEPSLEDLYEDYSITGTPEHVRDKIRMYQLTIGFTQLNCFFRIGDLDIDTVKSSMRLFAEKVIPHFR